jgi:putative transcriptional regulator
MFYIEIVKLVVQNGGEQMKNNVEQLIKKHGITKSKLANEIGVTRQTIVRICKGFPPSLEIGLKIADYFQKDVKDIFFYDDVKHVEQITSTDKQSVNQ